MWTPNAAKTLHGHWGVGAYQYPQSTRTDNQRIVHSERDNRRASNRCQTMNHGAVIAPHTMLSPAVFPRMEERDLCPGDPVRGSRARVWAYL